MAQPKALLAIGAGAVVAAAIVLIVALNKKDRPTPPTASGDPIAVNSPGAPPVGEPGRPNTPVIKSSERGEVERVDRPEPVEYEVDGVKIRDHRKNPTEMKLPPNIHPPEQKRLSTGVVNAIHQQVRALGPTCMKDVPAADRGAKPKLDIQVVVAVKDGKATVFKSTAATTDVNGASADAVKLCMQDKAIGLAADAKDEAETESYSINLSLPL